MIVVPFYFGSMLDSATFGRFLLLQLTTLLPEEDMKPLVDLLFETLPTQSTFMYPCTCNLLLASLKIPHYKIRELVFA
jgi:hypothetical protein